ncbi:MAG: tetratricopeptide repeat protein, partial [Saprospiraceae bacterium]|nr:tetratricopeptide repeat protein [Saprospiraceae bacterium]
FNTAIAINSDNIETISARGTYFLLGEQLEKAKNDFLTITRKDRQHSNSFFNLGLIYLEQDSIAKANQMFNITLQTNPIFMKAYYYRGYSHELLGRNKLALSDYQQVARHDPDYKDVSDRISRLNPDG